MSGSTNCFLKQQAIAAVALHFERSLLLYIIETNWYTKEKKTVIRVRSKVEIFGMLTSYSKDNNNSL